MLALCQRADQAFEGERVIVDLEDGRRHEVTVKGYADCFRFTALVVRRATLAKIPDASVRVWLRNRETQLVGFRIDERGHLQADAWLPKAGMNFEEFQFYLRSVAIEADRMEFILTGLDRT
jgi:hypothetical protein